MRCVDNLPEDKSQWTNDELERELVFAGACKADGPDEAQWYDDLLAEHLRRFPEGAKWIV